MVILQELGFYSAREFEAFEGKTIWRKNRKSAIPQTEWSSGLDRQWDYSNKWNIEQGYKEDMAITITEVKQ